MPERTAGPLQDSFFRPQYSVSQLASAKNWRALLSQLMDRWVGELAKSLMQDHHCRVFRRCHLQWHITGNLSSHTAVSLAQHVEQLLQVRCPSPARASPTRDRHIDAVCGATSVSFFPFPTLHV